MGRCVWGPGLLSRAARMPQSQLRPRLRLSATRRIHFTASCLPRTMELAELVTPLLEKHLPTPGDWPFHDRVFVWLAPHFRSKAVEFHEGHGTRLDRCHGANLLHKLDDELFVELVRRVDTLLSK